MAYILMINSDVAAVYSNRQAARKDAKHFRERGPEHVNYDCSLP